MQMNRIFLIYLYFEIQTIKIYLSDLYLEECKTECTGLIISK